MAELVSISYIKFAKAQSKLEVIGQKFKDKIVPKELFELFNSSSLFENKLEYLSKFKSCKRIGKLQAELSFNTVSQSRDVSIFKADPFQFLNTTGNEICLNTYVGPPYVMFNQTADCMIPLVYSDISDNAVRGIACTARQRLAPNESFWASTECNRRDAGEKKIRQIKNHQYAHFINCQGYRINTNHEEHDCPNNVFSIPESESFNIGDYYYSHAATNMMTKL